MQAEVMVVPVEFTVYAALRVYSTVFFSRKNVMKGILSPRITVFRKEGDEGEEMVGVGMFVRD